MKPVIRTFLFAALLLMSGGFSAAESEAPDRIALFNGENLDGWKIFPGPGGAPPANTWRVQDGVLQNKASACTVTRGFIALQSEGVPIEFRNIVLEPLKPAAETSAVAAAHPLRVRLPRMVFARVEFRHARLTDVLDYIREQSPALDPDQVGISIVLMDDGRLGATPITLSMQQVPADRLLRLLCEAAGASMRVDDQAVVIRPIPPRPAR